MAPGYYSTNMTQSVRSKAKTLAILFRRTAGRLSRN